MPEVAQIRKLSEIKEIFLADSTYAMHKCISRTKLDMVIMHYSRF